MTQDFCNGDTLSFASDGAERLRWHLTDENLADLEEALSDQPSCQAGIRLYGIKPLVPLLSSERAIGAAAAAIIGVGCQPVRAILFDKTAKANWLLPWHQDRTIAVKKRVDVAGFGPWTVKKGQVHVEPPFDLLAGMVTVRVHLDPVPMTNAPLLIAPGSQKLGRIPVNSVEEVVRRCGIAACLADRGDLWLYATAILHASRIAAAPSHRRVLQVDFAGDELPGGLEWLGV